MQETGFFFPPLKQSVTDIRTIAAVSLRFYVSAFAAPVTHQDLGRQVLSGWPFPLKADQKIIGSRPCPKGFSGLMVFNQPQGGSRHGQ
jgi:hypothetical protein